MIRDESTKERHEEQCCKCFGDRKYEINRRDRWFEEIIDESAQIWGGTSTVTYSTIQGLDFFSDGTGNIEDDPLFIDSGYWVSGSPYDGRVVGDYRLSAGSACIDAADNTAVPDGIVTDLDGNPRFVDDPNTDDTGYGDPPIVDMGPYEFRDPCADDDGDGRVTICHIPPGNPENAHTITVSVNAVQAHMGHGDYCGPCEGDPLKNQESGSAKGEIDARPQLPAD